ncbi:PAS domain S-box protein [Leptolyngbya sp. FACHB-261]|uniref:PAS domain S-box protein n=1 Tax=Leptolyngbya sp. FACHB-261 TaxID=2692806 RepID=UPI0016845CBC|nr:PAS domain S-box protein [Leptolyngbya sp. FACHB-261]MBD2099461.1 PAS domain S-box protein [Leptolyngbya sp. FACHB-261]
MNLKTCLRNLSAALNRLDEPDTLFQQLVDQLAQALSADCCTLWRLETEQFVLQYQAQLNGAVLEPWPEPSFSLSSWNEGYQHLRQQQILRVSINNRRRQNVQLLPPKLQCQGFLGIPIFAKNQLVGFLGLCKLHQPLACKPAQISCLRELAELTGVALSLTDLLRQAQTATPKPEPESEPKPAACDGLSGCLSMEQALRLSEARYRNIIEGQTELICRLGPDLRVTFGNEAYCRQHRKSTAEIIGQHLLTEVPEEEHQYLLDHFASLGRDKPIDISINRVISAQGKTRWYEWTDQAILDEQGNLIEFQCVGRDITEQRQAEEKLRISEARYRAIVEDQTELVCRFTPDGNLTFVNDAYCHYFNKSLEELIGIYFASFDPPAQLQEVKENIRNLTPEKPTSIIEEYFVTSTGEVRWQEWTDRALFNEQGHLVEIQSVGRDITKRKQAEQQLHQLNAELEQRVAERTAALQASEQQYRRMIETTIEGVWIIDAQNHTSFVNPQMAEMLGYSVDEMLGRSLFDFMDEAGQAIAVVNLEHHRQGIGERYDFKLQRKDGSELWTIVAANAIFDPAGQYAGALGMITDITDRKAAEAAIAKLNQELQHRVTELQALFDVIPVGIGIAEDPKCQQVRVNVTGAELLEISLEINSSCTPPLETPPSFRFFKQGRELQGEEGVLQQAITWGRKIRDEEVDLIKADGSVANLLFHAAPLLDEQGQIRGAVNAFIDITERKRAEEVLRTQALVLEHMAEGVAIIDHIENTIYFTNPAFDAMFGYERGELLGKKAPVLNPYPLDEDPEFMRELIENLNTFGFWTGEFSNCKKDGALFTTQSRMSLLEISGKQYRISVEEDITERKQIEEALRQSEQRFRQLAENSSELFWLSGIEPGSLLYVSPAYEKIWGRSLESVYEQPRSWLEAIHPDDREHVVSKFQQRANGEATDVEYRVVRPDGSACWIWHQSFPIYDETGQLYRFGGIGVDITERKRAQALEQANRELQQANASLSRLEKIKTELVATVSHEIRMPITNIYTGISVLKDLLPPISPEARKMLNLIESEARRQVQLVNSLLDFSKLDSGTYRWREDPVDLKTVLLQAVQSTAVLYESRHVQLHCSLPETIQVLGDAERLVQLVVNLLDNAAKFSSENRGVWLSLRREGKHGVVSVRDQGPGIPAQQQVAVFDLFSQVYHISGKRPQGIGLGLHLCRQIAQHHGGNLSVESRPGKGSTFKLTLPLLSEKPDT